MGSKARIIFLSVILKSSLSAGGVPGSPHAVPAPEGGGKSERVNSEAIGRAEADNTCLTLPEARRKDLETQLTAFTELKQEPFRHQLSKREIVDGRTQDVYPYHEILEKRLDLLKKVGVDLLEAPGCGLVMVRRLQEVLVKERDGKSLQELVDGDGHSLLAVGLDDLQRIFEGRLHKIPVTSRPVRTKTFAHLFPHSNLYTEVDPEKKELDQNIQAPAALGGYGQAPRHHPVLRPAAENFLLLDPAKHVFYLTQDLELKDFREERMADGKGFSSSFRLVPKSIVDSVKAALVTSSVEELPAGVDDILGRRGLVASPGYGGHYLPYSGFSYGPVDSNALEYQRSAYKLDISFPSVRRKTALPGQWRDIEVYDLGLSVGPDFLTTIRPAAKTKEDPEGYHFKLRTDVPISSQPVLLEYRTNEITPAGVAGPRRERQILLKPPKAEELDEE